MHFEYPMHWHRDESDLLLEGIETRSFRIRLHRAQAHADDRELSLFEILVKHVKQQSVVWGMAEKLIGGKAAIDLAPIVVLSYRRHGGQMPQPPRTKKDMLSHLGTPSQIAAEFSRVTSALTNPLFCIEKSCLTELLKLLQRYFSKLKRSLTSPYVAPH
jgi:hypothetical protein